MPDKQSDAQTRNDLATLLGGEEVTAPCNNGTCETVRVRKLPMRDRLKYIELCVDGDGQGIIELCCGLPPNAADKFTPEAQDDLLEKAKALNFLLAVQHLERMAEDSRKLAPLYQKTARRMLDQTGPLLTQFAQSLMPVLMQHLSSASPESKSSTKAPTGSDSASPATTAAKPA